MVIGFWLIVLAFGSVLAQRWLEQRQNPNRSLTASQSAGKQSVSLLRNAAGHYVATITINGLPVTALLDTGATSLSIPLAVAQRLGLSSQRESLAVTANGTITVYDLVLSEVAIAGISERDIRAHINPHMPGEQVLLGMSFLNRFDLDIRDGVLRLSER